ncbi:MAG: DUF4388 domain-containing protein [Chloroflexota bacterium]|nr:DUF4388 domain-containing protein [Chloroflexota bacterium]
MTLRAQLQAFPLETILQILAATEKTGRLEVRGDEGRGFLGVSSGRLVSAEYEDEQGRRALGAIFTILRGDLEFVPGEGGLREDLSGDLDGLLDQAVEERDRIVRIRDVIPSDRTRFALSARAADQGQITLAPEQWRALLAVDGERDVAAIAEKVGLTRLAAQDLLATLVRSGMVDALEPAAGAAEQGAYRRLPPMRPIPPTGAGEAVVLSGDLPDLPLETIVQLLAATKKTGRLEIAAGPESATLGMSDGRLVSAAAGEEDGELALGAAFAVGAGEFDFVPMPEAPAADLSGEVDELLDRAAGLRDRIAAVRALIPSDRSRFALSERATRNVEITLTPEQWRVLLAVHPQRDVGMVAEQLRMRRLPTLMILSDLIRGGFVDVVAPEAELSWPYVERRRTPWATPAPEVEERGPLAEEQATEEARAVEEPPATGEAPPAEEPPAAPAAEEVEAPLEETPIDREVEAAAEDDRLSALSGLFGPAEPAPPPTAWEPPAGEAEAAAAEATAAAFEHAPPAEEREEPAEVDPRLAAFGAPPAEPEALAEQEAPPQWQTWETPAEAAPMEAPPEEPAEVDPRFAALALPPLEEAAAAEPEAPAAEAETSLADAAAWPEATHVRPEPVAGRPLPEMPPLEAATPAAAPPEKKKGGLFGGLFGGKAAPVASTASLARTDAGRLALFANELIAAYNSGRYGKGRVEDRMIGLLMRVDEQADPIDRPIPLANDRIDVASIDDGLVPEAQAVPYLALLVRQVYDDAERVLGKDKARRGFRDARDRALGKEPAVLRAPAVAGRLPKV